MKKIVTMDDLRCEMMLRQTTSTTLTSRIANLREKQSRVRSGTSRTIDLTIVAAVRLRLREAERRQKEAQARVGQLLRDLKEIQQLRGALRIHRANLEAAEAEERRIRE